MSGEKNRQPEIIALGEPLVEFSAEEAGPLAEVSRFKVGCGGDTSNFAVAVSRLGGKAGYISRIGSDPFGEILIRCWETEGVDHSRLARDKEASTGLYFISRDEDRHHFTYYRRDSAASRMLPEDLPVDYIQRAKWLHISGISQAISPSAADTVERAVNVARQVGLVVSYDPNLRLKLWPIEKARAVIHRLVARVDILLPSYEDARELTGKAQPREIVQDYLAAGPRLIILKMGADGAIWGEIRPGDDRGPIIEKIPGFAVEAVDASGAGDTFDAAFAVARLEGRPTAECVRWANAAGALVTTGRGAVTPIPDRAAVEALMAGPTE
jgi:2-dehydro-3-deoxygluconokinase